MSMPKPTRCTKRSFSGAILRPPRSNSSKTKVMRPPSRAGSGRMLTIARLMDRSPGDEGREARLDGLAGDLRDAEWASQLNPRSAGDHPANLVAEGSENVAKLAERTGYGFKETGGLADLWANVDGVPREGSERRVEGKFEVPASTHNLYLNWLAGRLLEG